MRLVAIQSLHALELCYDMKGSQSPWVKDSRGRTNLPGIPISAGFRTSLHFQGQYFI